MHLRQLCSSPSGLRGGREERLREARHDAGVRRRAHDGVALAGPARF